VALSGGADSMALLQVLQEPGLRLLPELSVLHIHHGVRGEAADRDARFVADWCQSRQIPLTIIRLQDIRKTSETYLRQRRYQAFENHLINHPGLFLATAHHLKDDLETLLINLFNSSGLKTLRGIPSRRGQIIRPLLTCSRSEIEDYLRQGKIPFCTDETNADENILRNRLRHKLLPVLLEQMGTGSLQRFQTTMQQVKADIGFVNGLLDGYFASEIICHEKCCRIPLKFWDGLGRSGRRFCLGFVLEKLLPAEIILRPPGQKALEIFIRDSQAGKQFFPFGRRLIFEKEREFIAVYPVKSQLPESVLLSPGQPVVWMGYKIEIREVSPDTIRFSKNPGVEYICGDRLKFPLLIRGWQPGDCFYPINGHGQKKLSDFFIDQQLSRLQKENVPIIENDNQIVWIVGYRLDHRYRIKTDCRRKYQIQMESEHAP